MKLVVYMILHALVNQQLQTAGRGISSEDGPTIKGEGRKSGKVRDKEMTRKR